MQVWAYTRRRTDPRNSYYFWGVVLLKPSTVISLWVDHKVTEQTSRNDYREWETFLNSAPDWKRVL